jgi:hypothetical protein
MSFSWSYRTSYAFLAYPATSAGTKRFIAFRSALLRFAFRFFAMISPAPDLPPHERHQLRRF